MVWESTEGFLDYSNISIVDSGQILPIYGHFLPLNSTNVVKMTLNFSRSWYLRGCKEYGRTSKMTEEV